MIDKTVSGLSIFPLFSARGGALDAPGDEETNKRFLKDGVNITPTLFEPLFSEDNQELCKLILNGEARAADLDLHGKSSREDSLFLVLCQGLVASCNKLVSWSAGPRSTARVLLDSTMTRAMTIGT